MRTSPALTAISRVVDGQAGDGGHAMFDGLTASAGLDSSAAGAAADVLDEGGDADGSGEVGADKDDAVAHGGGSEGEGAGDAGEEAASGDGGLG
jgi:hypothetical protein